MELAATICSRQKDPDVTMMPAHRRYLGAHVAYARARARDMGLPFFVLSGKFGLLRDDDPVPYYDYRLGMHDVEWLARIVVAQYGGLRVTHVWFWHEAKESWGPYLKVMTTAAARTGAGLVLMPVPPGLPELRLVRQKAPG